jgi:hypothetical protein
VAGRQEIDDINPTKINLHQSHSYFFGIYSISKQGIADVKLFNPRDLPLFIGCEAGAIGTYSFLLTSYFD